MNFKFRSILLFLKISIKLILCRPFGGILFDIAAKYDNISSQDLRRLEKIVLKENKAKLDVTFLENCRTFGVRLKFINFRCYQADYRDERYIKQYLLKSAITKRNKEHSKFELELRKLKSELKSILTPLDYFIIIKAINYNAEKHERVTIKTHFKKLMSLTDNRSLPFTPNDTIMNLSNYELTESEKDILKYGLKYSIPPFKLNKTDILATFDIMHRVMLNDIKDTKDKGKLKSEISFIANNYVDNYKPSKSTLKKHVILKRLRSNKQILILS